jgi:DNA-binding transcriptional LysR family regulator
MNVRPNRPARSALIPVFLGSTLRPTGGLAERYPRLNIELTLTDDFIDPHRDAADLIFRIGADGLDVHEVGQRVKTMAAIINAKQRKSRADGNG